jgi:starvation-inducible DNA-binding protein
MSQDLITHLNKVLADAVVFYYKAHNSHWNVRGPEFFSLHAQFEALYTEWATHMDDIAERVLQLGGKPVPTLAAAVQASSISEETGSPDARAMVRNTVADLHTHRERILATIAVAEKAGDRATCNLLDAINDSIEKTVWMFNAALG